MYILKKIIAIVGPTASGKTALSIAVAKKLDGEIISCDSMQIYRKMDIGTAKPTEAEKCGIPHHLIDIIEPSENFSAADYAALAKNKIEEIYGRNKLPIFCGGTGLYLDSVVRGTSFEDVLKDEKYRAELLETAESEGGADKLYGMLSAVDAKSAEAIHKNNVKRVIRALEIYHSSGIPKSELDRRSKEKPKEFDLTAIGIRYNNRDVLYERINARVDKMLADGLAEEVKSLYENGLLAPEYTASQAIGYKEFIEYYKGNIGFDEAVENLKQATRRYAKRQMTWFSAHDYVNFIDADGKNFDEITEEALKIIDKN